MADLHLLTSLRYDKTLIHSAANTALGPRPVESGPELRNGHENARPTPFYMLAHHRDRLITSATRLGWSKAATAPALASIASFETALLTEVQAYASTSTCSTDPTGTPSASMQDHHPMIPSPLRIRVLLNEAGTLTVQIFPTASTPLATLFPTKIPVPSNQPPSPLKIYLDTTPTTYPPVSFNSDPQRDPPSKAIPKTTHRPHYSAPRTRFNLSPSDVESDVLLFTRVSSSQHAHSPENLVTETTISNILFWRVDSDPEPGCNQVQDQNDGQEGTRGRRQGRGRWVTPDIAELGGIEGTVRQWLLENGHCEVDTVRMEEVEAGEEVWVCNGVRGVRRGVIIRE